MGMYLNGDVEYHWTMLLLGTEIWNHAGLCYYSETGRNQCIGDNINSAATYVLYSPYLRGSKCSKITNLLWPRKCPLYI